MTTAKPHRRTKTPTERAEEQLGIADRKVARLRAHAEDLATQVEANRLALIEAEQIQSYAQAHPALDQQHTTSSTDQEEGNPA